MLGILLVPSGLLLGLALASGGFFPDSVSVAVVAVLAIFSARVILSRTALAWPGRGVAVVVTALMAFAVLTLVSGSWSGSSARSTFEYDLVLLYTVVFVLFGSVGRSTARARVLLLSLAAASVAISIAAVATWLLPDLLPVARDIPRERLAWPTSYWNVTGLIAALGLVWAFSLSCSSAEPVVVRVVAAAAVPWPAAVLIFTASRGAAAVALLGLVVSTAMIRSPATLGGLATAGPAIAVSAIVSLGVSGLNVSVPTTHALHAAHQTMIVLVVVALAAAAARMLLVRLDARMATARAPWTRTQVRAALGVAAAGLVIAFLAVGGPRAVRSAAHKFVAPEVAHTTLARQRFTQLGSNGRIDEWRVALDAFLRHPLIGNGAGTYATLWTRYGRTPIRVLNAHSLYLEELAELGILGGGLVIAAVISMLVALARRAQGPGRAVWGALFAGALMWAVHSGVDWDWQMPAASAWFFAAGGLALAAPVERPVRRTRPLLRYAIGLGCLLLVITPVAVWRSQIQILKAVRDFGRGNCIAAERAALASNAALSSRWEPFEVLSYCDAGAHEYSLALHAITAARKRDPDNWELPYSEALIRASAGRDPRPAARAALELYPRSPLTRAASSAFSRGGPREWRRFGVSAPLPLPWTRQ
jgi:O-Antigen ligase